eukprot:2147624-Prymnesium_polylepis.2
MERRRRRRGLQSRRQSRAALRSAFCGGRTQGRGEPDRRMMDARLTLFFWRTPLSRGIGIRGVGWAVGGRCDGCLL